MIRLYFWTGQRIHRPPSLVRCPAFAKRLHYVQSSFLFSPWGVVLGNCPLWGEYGWDCSNRLNDSGNSRIQGQLISWLLGGRGWIRTTDPSIMNSMTQRKRNRITQIICNMVCNTEIRHRLKQACEYCIESSYSC